MKAIDNAVDIMRALELSNNSFLRTFLNTASSTFDSNLELSIWTSNPNILFKDLRNLDKLILSISSLDKSDRELIDKRIEVFKEVLSVDFNTDFRITYTPLKIPMMELWSNTRLGDVWVDRAKFNFNPEDAGKVIFIPYDYYLYESPIIFMDGKTELLTDIGNTIKVSKPQVIARTLPYIEYTI